MSLLTHGTPAMLNSYRSSASRALFALCIATSGVASTTSAQQEILVSGFDSGVHRYDFETGAFLGTARLSSTLSGCSSWRVVWCPRFRSSRVGTWSSPSTHCR